MRSRNRFLLLAFALLPAMLFSQVQQKAVVISVDAAHPGAAISPSMFGIFFEDINFGADGGLYPELVKNRSFEFQEPLIGWHEVLGFSQKGLDNPKGELSIRTEDPLNPDNPHYLRARVYEPGYGFYNTGFRGIGVQSGAEYRFSASIRSHGPKAIRFTLTDEKRHEIASGKIEGFGDQWKRYETVIKANATEPHAQLNLFIDEAGSIDFDMVSLFPVDTWGHRPNGLRKDLVQLLADMHPGFLRFPGGCIVEGRQLVTIDGTLNSTKGRLSITSSLSAWAFMNTSNWPRTSARLRCLSSIAVWPASSIPVRRPRSTNSANMCRMRST